MFSIFGAEPNIVISIAGNESLNEYRDRVLRTDLPCYEDGDTIKGTYKITPPPGKNVSHKGIKLELVGEVRKNTNEVVSRIFARSQEICPPGDLRAPIKADFAFDNVKFPTGSYIGTHAIVVYSVQIVVVHLMKNYKVEEQFVLLSFDERPESNESLHNEVGIRGVIHMEFIFPHQFVDCTESVVGSIYFILIKLRIVKMALYLYRSETFVGENSYVRNKTCIDHVEIMDGSPVKGDPIPIRLFVSAYNIWPLKNFRGTPLKVEHYLRVQLVDENGKSYYKRLKVDFKRFRPTAP